MLFSKCHETTAVTCSVLFQCLIRLPLVHEVSPPKPPNPKHCPGVQPFHLSTFIFPPLTSLKAETLPLITQCSSQLTTNQPKSHRKRLKQSHSPLDHPNHMLIKFEKIKKHKQEICSAHGLNLKLHMFGSKVRVTQRTYGKWR